ncbi:hypothetical protein D3C71_1598260 [compost metagenome]
MLRQIEQLAQNIAIARKRRGESQAQWARKLGISQPTMARIERGDPAVSMASYVMCMWLINQAGGLADLIAPQHDHSALEKEVAKVRAQPKPGKQVGPDTAPSPPQVAPSSRTRSRPLLSGRQKLSERAPAPMGPLDEVRKSLARTATPSERARPGAASGLAALMAGSDPKEK